MTLEQIRAALAAALVLRPPKFEPGTPVPEKVSSLADYLLDSAYAQAELEECYHYLNYTIELLREKVEHMTGYEVALPRKPQDRITQADILSAKRTVDAPTFSAGAEAKQLRESVKRQIDRFRFEAGQGPISRAYTLITGG